MITEIPKIIQVCLFTLSGGGDTEIFLAPSSAAEWCMSVKPGEHTLPLDIQEELIPFLDEDRDPKESISITIGSAHNDAALFLSGVCRSFHRQRDAVAFAEKQGWVIDEDEYEGYLY